MSHGKVLRTGDDAKRSRRLEIDRIDGLTLAGNLSDRCSSIGHEHVSVAFAAFPADRHPLTVRRPGQILDGTAERLEFILENVLLLRGVPDSNFTSHIYQMWTKRDIINGSAYRLLIVARDDAMTINQPINQSIQRSITRSNDPTINQSINRSIWQI